MLLFKYVSPDAIPKVFQSADEMLVRFGLPRAYNDPYELFLEPDRPLASDEERAFYDFFLGKVVEAPVACFSRRPDSVVMWAHYGRDGAGICLAVDEDTFVDRLPVAFVGDIEYTDGPATIDSEYIRYAY